MKRKNARFEHKQIYYLRHRASKRKKQQLRTNFQSHSFWIQGVCEKSIQDVVERFWDIIEEININKVLKFMRDNIVSKYF